MILEHEEITVDFFDKFPKDVKKVLLYLSGGADSALILYILSKLDVEIYPLHGYEVSQPELDSITAVNNVVDWVRHKSPDATIHKPFIYPMHQGSETKYYYLKPARKYFEQRHGVYHIIFGTSQGMDDDPRPINHRGSMAGEELSNISWDDILAPWKKVNKKFIAAQYRKLGLEELSHITNSCITSTKEPCRECWWCKERYWAFGSYDGGIQ